MELEPFSVRYRRALDDAQLRANLLAFQRKWAVARVDGLESAAVDFAVERERLKAIKNDVVANMPRYLGQFRAAVEEAGATTFMATGPEDAIAYIADLARSRGIQRVVKSKSMVSEEIGLNHGLEAAGLQVVETDLGEWIVQLAGERPSHIIGPALHKNRRQVAELFSRVTGQEVDPEDIGKQVQVAQRALRESFLHAQIGISGANALVAESGTVMLVTNEGNAEIVTSIPPIHVVLVGLEKLLPTLDDAMLQLRLLAPSATGQAATAYVSWITGPTAPDTEMHVVLIDNGRMAMRDAPQYVDALRCIRCGACSNICPSYGVVGGHVFGYVYSGAIGLVNTPFHHGIEHDVGPQSLCVSCNACQTVCPVDIPLPRQILDTRAWAVRAEGVPLLQRLGLAMWSRPNAGQIAIRAATRLQRPLQRGPWLLPPPGLRDRQDIRRLISWRYLPALADEPFRDKFGRVQSRRLSGPMGGMLKGMTIGFFVQCLTDWVYPEMGEAIVDSLEALGARVVFPRAQHCCGLPAHDSGHPDIARRMARQTIAVLDSCQADYIVSGGVSCVVAILHEYGQLFDDEPEWQMRAERLTGRVMDYTSFMSRVVQLAPGSLPKPVTGSATYHYFCQSYNVLGFRNEPMSLLADVCGVELCPLPEASWCCGFGGSVSFARPDISRGILDRKLQNLDSTGATTLVTDNPGCILHLRGGIAASSRKVRVMHTAEVVAESMRTALKEG